MERVVGPYCLADCAGNLPPNVEFACPIAGYRDMSFQIVVEAPIGTVWAFEYYFRLERNAPWVKVPDTYNDPSNLLTNTGSCIHTFRTLPVCSDVQMRVTHTSQDCSLVKLRVWMVQWVDSASRESLNEIVSVGYNWLSASLSTEQVAPNATAPEAVNPSTPVVSTEEPADAEEVDVARFRQL